MVLGDRGHDMQKEAMLPFVTGVMPLAAFDHLPRAPDMPCIFRSRLHSKFHLCANSSVVSARKWKVRLARHRRNGYTCPRCSKEVGEILPHGACSNRTMKRALLVCVCLPCSSGVSSSSACKSVP